MNGRGTLSVTAQTVGTLLELWVSDEGPGIPPDVREHLFEPFFTTKHRGTGLGLATARRILNVHRGTLDMICPREDGIVTLIKLPLDTTAGTSFA